MLLWPKKKAIKNAHTSVVQIISDRKPKSEAQQAIETAFVMISEIEKRRKELQKSL